MVAGSSPAVSTFSFLWRNGSASGFDPEDTGSNPVRKSY
jgi:hypothetical protein